MTYRKYFKLLIFLPIGLLTGYFTFLLILWVTGNLPEWEKRIRDKYGVGIWDV